MTNLKKSVPRNADTVALLSLAVDIVVFTWFCHFDLPVIIVFVCVDVGIEIDDDKLGEGDSDFTIRGRLMSLVEKVAYLKKKMADMPKKKKAKKPSKCSQFMCVVLIFSVDLWPAVLSGR